MKTIRYETTQEELEKLDHSKPVIFLAGPTVRGNQTHLTSWRFDAIDEFQKAGFDGTLIVPEFTSKTESDQHRYDIPLWEYTGLCKADCIMFWIPRTRELIGLTTNHELGYWMARQREKLVYGRPPTAYRMAYCDIMWRIDASRYNTATSTTIYDTLQDTVSAAKTMAEKAFKNNSTYLLDSAPSMV